jgi:hypothetical protein
MEFPNVNSKFIIIGVLLVGGFIFKDKIKGMFIKDESETTRDKA